MTKEEIDNIQKILKDLSITSSIVNQEKYMTFGKLVDRILRRVKDNDDIMNKTISIRLMDDSVGGVATAKVVNLHDGFDWDSGKIFLDTDKMLMSYDKDIVNKSRKKFVINVEGYIQFEKGLCPNCDKEITHKFNFCPECGQKLNWDRSKITC